MRFFFVKDQHKAAYRGTLGEAHKLAKDAYSRFDVEITELDVPTDKANIANILNGEDWIEGPVIRLWELSPRGGLHLIHPPGGLTKEG